MCCELDHLGINVTDAEKMLEFYCDVLGLPGERVGAYRAHEVAFPSVRVSKETLLDFFPPHMWQNDGALAMLPELGRLNHMCIAMSKAEWFDARERLLDRGVPIELGPIDRFGAHGTGISIYVRDPEKNLVELKYYGEKDELSCEGMKS